MARSRLGNLCGSGGRGIAGLESMVQTDVHQDAADYSRCPGKRKCYR
jgi:hypothetical protein